MTDKSFQILECEDYSTIQRELLNYIDTFTNIRTNDPRADDYDPVKNPVQYANFPERFGYKITHFVKQNPALIKWLSSFNLVLRDAYFTLAWSSRSTQYAESSCPIHLDKPPVYWKLNFPILNMERTSVRFYELIDPTINISSLVQRTGDPDSKDRDEYILNYTDFREIDRHDFKLNQPVLMNGMIPHDIGFYSDPTFPRLGLQGMFIKEPLHLL